MKLFIFTTILLLLFGCTNSNEPKTIDSKPLIRVTVNEQMELIRIAWNLAWQDDIEDNEKSTPSTYLVSVEKHFTNWSGHKLIRFIIESELYDYSFPSIGLSLDSNFSSINPKGIEKWENIYGKKVISAFLKKLRKFAQDTKSASFFKTKKSEKNLFCKNLKLKVDSTNWIENYASVFPEIYKVKRIVLYIDALNNSGNTEVSMDKQSIGILYPYYSDNPTELRKKPMKAVGINLNIADEITFYHELSHFMTTGLTNKHYDEIKSTIQCYFSIPPEENATSYYRNQLDETIVRAYSIFVLYKVSHGKSKVVNAYLENQIKEYKMIKKVFNLIKKYDLENSNSSNERHILLLETLAKEHCN